MDDKRAQELASIAYIIIANELGFTSEALDDVDLAHILIDNQVTLDEMMLLDEMIQNILEMFENGMV